MTIGFRSPRAKTYVRLLDISDEERQDDDQAVNVAENLATDLEENELCRICLESLDENACTWPSSPILDRTRTTGTLCDRGGFPTTVELLSLVPATFIRFL